MSNETISRPSVTFGPGPTYRCESVWVLVPEASSSPIERVYERRVTWTLVPKFRFSIGNTF